MQSSTGKQHHTMSGYLYMQIVTCVCLHCRAEAIYETYDNFRAIINSTGHIRWEPGGVFRTMCQIDITHYPFDHQNCEMTFGAWSYHTTKMNLTNSSAHVNMDSYKTNGEWEIEATLARREEFAYSCCPQEPFSNVAFVVTLSRRHTFYIMNVILPSILTSGDVTSHYVSTHAMLTSRMLLLQCCSCPSFSARLRKKCRSEWSCFSPSVSSFSTLPTTFPRRPTTSPSSVRHPPTP